MPRKARGEFRTSVFILVPNNLYVSWEPLNVELDVWSCLEDVVEAVNYVDGKVLSCYCCWGCTPPDDYLVVDR